jgi:hypothetical protein
MQVFTTIYLVETLRANIRHVEESPEVDQTLRGPREFTEALQRRLSELERRLGRDFA